MLGALSDERTGLSFTIAAGPRQRNHFRVRVPWDRPLPTVLIFLFHAAVKRTAQRTPLHS
jgi:hypothetical protein